MKEYNLTEGSILKTLLFFAAPFLAANILQSLYGAVDLFVVGKYCTAESVAAVATGTQVTQIITSLITGLTLGSTILIGQYTGRREFDTVKKIIGTTLTVFAATAAALTVIMLLLERPLLVLLETPSESFSQTMEYVTICLLGNIFVCGYNAISAILRGYGDSARPMIFVAVACAINIALDFLLVGMFGLGVAGTALATVVSQGVSMGIAVIYLKKKAFIFDFKWKSFYPAGDIVKKLARVGIPISFQEFMVRISFLYLMAVMNRCGVYAASVAGIGSKYDVFAMLSAASMASALSALTAQNIGAGKADRARKSLWYGMSFALAVSCLFWLWAQLSPQSMLQAFTHDENVIAAGMPFFRSCSYDYIMVTMVFCLNGYLNGKQKTVWTMVSCSVGALLLRIPLVYFFGTYFSEDLGMLGRIAPIVSGIMACYTLIYVVYGERRIARTKDGQRGNVFGK